MKARQDGPAPDLSGAQLPVGTDPDGQAALLGILEERDSSNVEMAGIVRGRQRAGRRTVPALHAVWVGDGSSIADVPDEALMKGFGT
ncbi:MAG: hypothetical protein ABR573_08340 [Candidatus Dormibacteria bacterium]